MRTVITALLALLLIQPVNALAGPHDCVNPAGHTRGWCKSGNSYGNDSGGYRNTYATISGTVIATNGDIAQFREDNGSTVTISEHSLLNSGQGLTVGGHYVLRGYWNNNMFVAQTFGNEGYGNGYPQPGSVSSVRGVITAVGNNRVTIMQGLFSSITINDAQALNNGTAQNLFVGRSVTAYGYWNGGIFYATSIG